jgi:hypothetical protein
MLTAASSSGLYSSPDLSPKCGKRKGWKRPKRNATGGWRNCGLLAAMQPEKRRAFEAPFEAQGKQGDRAVALQRQT